MAVKKKSAKKPVKKVTTKQAKSATPVITFPKITDDMSQEDKLKALGQSSNLLIAIQQNLAMTTPVDAKPAMLAIVANKITLIDKKLLYVGSEINKLNAIISKKKASAPIVEATKDVVEGVMDSSETIETATNTDTIN